MSAKPSPAPSGPEISHEKVAERARQLWMERGSPGGRDLEHWLDAERQLRDDAARRSIAGGAGKDLNEAEKRLDGLIENSPSPARRTPKGERL